MKKKEIEKELKEIRDILDMDPAEYAKLNNLKKEYDVWAYRTGVVIARIEYILKN